MTETIRVRYNRRFSQKLGDDFDTTEIGGEWEFETPAENFEDEYRKAYYIVTKTIDRLMDGVSERIESEKASKPVSEERPRAVASRPEYDADDNQDTSEYRVFERGESEADIVERQPVHIPRARVWDVKSGETKNKKPYVAVRVGNLDHIPTRNGYARVKSYNAALIRKLEALTPERPDYVNLWGHYESWQGNEGTMWDFVPERVEKL